jgi:hypothetical protein
MNGLFAGWGARLRQSVVGLMALLLLLAFAQSSRADFSISDAQVTEGNDGDMPTLRFTVTRTGNLNAEGFAVCRTEDGSARQGGSDYEGALEALFFPAGVKQQFFNVTVFGDSEVEPDETLRALISSQNGEPITDAEGVGTILNDDEATPTAAPVVTAPANGSTVATRQPTYTGTADPGSTVTIFVDGNAVGGTMANPEGNFALPQPTPLDFGTHTVFATATTNAGTSISDANTFTVEQPPVDPPVVTAPTNGSTVATRQPTYTGTADPARQ